MTTDKQPPAFSPAMVANLTADIDYFLQDALGALKELKPKSQRQQLRLQQAILQIEYCQKQNQTVNESAGNVINLALESKE